MKVKTVETDVFINGGGPVGLILAIGLARQNRQVVLVERSAPKRSPSFDGRVLALSYGSKLMLETLGLWDLLVPFTTPIEHVHVSQKGFLGLTHLHAQEMKVPALGYSISASDLGEVLWQQAQSNEQIVLLSECELTDFQQTPEAVALQVQCQQDKIKAFSAKLLVGADGTHSKVRQILNLPLEVKDYDAVGFIAKITTELPPEGWSFERFTTEGPVALLPMGGCEHKAVMVVPKAKQKQVESLDDEGFIQAFTEKMGERLGQFVAVSDRVVYPLKETYVPTMVEGRAVLMGNASHTQHPVAAQGLNLGINDIQAFLSLVDSCDDVGNSEILEAYQQKQKDHHQKIMGFTDGLIQVFQNTSSVVGRLRGLGLMVMESMPRLRKRLSKMGMGLAES